MRFFIPENEITFGGGGGGGGEGEFQGCNYICLRSSECFIEAVGGLSECF